LKSALGVPETSYGGAYLHPGAAEMAAAYLFHSVRNHPFVDGNKRVGLIAALAFLGLNELRLDADALFDLVLGVAAGTVAKAEVAVFNRSTTANLPGMPGPRKPGRSIACVSPPIARSVRRFRLLAPSGLAKHCRVRSRDMR